jgi:macrolide transport system ATP-binding/permease protein
LRKVRREYPAGEGVVVALNDIDLDIAAGEMVAIMGASGSGKSTLMNVIGCLDRPTSGEYLFDGRDTRLMSPDELAQLRREHFGFIFQRFHLLSDLTAVGNVEVPAIYLGREAKERHALSTGWLQRLGMGDRMLHKPNQLSGGQQQRVSIARALINGGRIILADEPTGALDTATGEEVMGILKSLQAEGHTIILVTHEENVARYAERKIVLQDGAIVSDIEQAGAPTRATAVGRPSLPVYRIRETLGAWRDRFMEGFRMAVLAMRSHKLRTFLTMLGIIIGIASVVSVVALGEGSRRQILSNISSLGTNRIDVMPGTGFGDRRASAIHTLTPADADAIASQSYVDSVTPSVSTSATLKRGNVSASAQVSGVGEQYFRVRGMELVGGSLFSQSSLQTIGQHVVIDTNTRDTLFEDGTDPVGQVIIIGAMPAWVIGVVQSVSAGPGTGGLNIFAPYTSVMRRMLGQSHLRAITVRVKDDMSMDAAAAALTRLLSQRHGTQDFYLSSTEEIRQTIEQTTATMTLLIASIALISLIVGGIGVMNIMLVSVTERVHEIGVRMAVGARRSDILQQFLIEAVLVCLLGGIVGILVAFGIGLVFQAFVTIFTPIYTMSSIVAAFGISTLIGLSFGFFPARAASHLDPIEALARL